MFPLHAAHPTQHDGDAFAIGALDHAVVGNFQFPADQVEPKVLYVADVCGIPLRVTPEEQVRCIRGPPDEVIAAVDLKVKVAATGADLRKAVVMVATLNDLPNAEINFLRVGDFAIRFEVEFKVIKIWFTPLVRPPEIGTRNRELSHLIRRKCRLLSFVGEQGDLLFENNGWLSRTRNFPVEYPGDRLAGVVTQVAVHGEGCRTEGG